MNFSDHHPQLGASRPGDAADRLLACHRPIPQDPERAWAAAGARGLLEFDVRVTWADVREWLLGAANVLARADLTADTGWLDAGADGPEVINAPMADTPSEVDDRAA